jgi:hypothetical protein|tara:strand:+ start:386 stop:1255 length:870 start_codon:yes stop_codon:yes gene_type:complete
MKSSIFNTVSILVIGMVVLSSCEDVVDVDLSDGSPQFAVDAFITDNKNPEIKLSLTQDYFDDSGADYLEDALVFISDGINPDYEFTFEDGAYRYPSIINLEEGVEYKLSIISGDNTYEAVSSVNPVPSIDSIGVEFQEGVFGFEAGYFAEFFARDIADREDFYWARYSRNDTLQNNPSDLIISQDASFSGNGADGLIFIPPIRQGINDFSRIYQSEEFIHVELWSIDETVFNYLAQVAEQTGIGGPLAIISAPTYNVLSNITLISGPSEQDPVGIFSVSKVSTIDYTFE